LKILLINGPNLNLLGNRERSLYGKISLKEIISNMEAEAARNQIEIISFQSNSEGALIDTIQQKGPACAWIIINAAAFTHTSVAIRDALLAVNKPFLEVHLSNIYRREQYRHKSYLTDAAQGIIAGLGAQSYYAALQYIIKREKK